MPLDLKCTAFCSTCIVENDFVLSNTELSSNIASDLPFLLDVAKHDQRCRYQTLHHIRPCFICYETLQQCSLAVPSSPYQSFLNMITLTQRTLVLIKLKCFLSLDCILPPSLSSLLHYSNPPFSVPSSFFPLGPSSKDSSHLMTWLSVLMGGTTSLHSFIHNCRQ